MTVMKKTGNNLQFTFKEIIRQYFDEKQLQAIKDVILYGGWGDTDIEFKDGTTCMAYGFCTNDTSEGGHFKGREVTRVWSEIAKVIKTTDAGKFMAHRNDYWGDGSGDMVFIRLGGFFKGGYDSFVEWAKKQSRPSAEVRCGLYLKELKEREALIEQDMKSEEVKANRKRIASLKRKIERASKAIEKSLKNTEE